VPTDSLWWSATGNVFLINTVKRGQSCTLSAEGQIKDRTKVSGIQESCSDPPGVLAT